MQLPVLIERCGGSTSTSACAAGAMAPAASVATIAARMTRLDMGHSLREVDGAGAWLAAVVCATRHEEHGHRSAVTGWRKSSPRHTCGLGARAGTLSVGWREE